MIERDPRLPTPAPAASALHGEGVLTVAEVEEALGLTPEPAPVDDEKPARRGSRTAFVLSLLTMGLLVGGVIVVMLKFLNGPVSEGAAMATPTPESRVAAVKTGSSLLSGEYFEMTYPGVFDQVGRPQKDAVALEQYMLSSKGDPRRTVAISVRPLESNNLNDDSNYRIRQIQPQDYKSRQEKLGPDNITVMSRNDNTEATLFWPHAGKVVIISATTSNPADSVDDYIKAILPTLRWRV